MIKRVLYIVALATGLSFLSSCSLGSDQLISDGGSSDVEITGSIIHSDGKTYEGTEVFFIPDSIELENESAYSEFSVTTNELGEFNFGEVSEGKYRLYAKDDLKGENYLIEEVLVNDTLNNLGEISLNKGGILCIIKPMIFKENAEAGYISGIPIDFNFNKNSDTLYLANVPVNSNISVYSQKYNFLISDSCTVLSKDTVTVARLMSVLYIIDTSAIKESFPVELADSLKAESLIDVKVLTIQEYKDSDTIGFDVIYLSSTLDTADKMWWGLNTTTKTVICASSDVYNHLGYCDLLNYGEDSTNSIQLVNDSLSFLFPDMSIKTGDNFNLFSSDTTKKQLVEWGNPGSNGTEILSQNGKCYLFNYNQGLILLNDMTSFGQRLGVPGSNYKQFNSNTIALLKNVIRYYGEMQYMY